MKNINPKNNQVGFTLIETLVAMFILTLIAVVVVNFQLDIFSLNKISNSNLLSQEGARRTLKNFSAEIRSVTASDAGAYALAQTATSSITFYTNIDSDASVEKIRYFLDGTILKKGTIKPTGNPATYNPADENFIILSNNIANATTSIFTYYDTDYDGTSPALTDPVSPSQVRLIKIDLIIDEDPSKDPPPLYMTTQATPRNLKDNL